MFDFLKKSRVAKFLCSACLICSLGSFGITNGDSTTLVGYVDIMAMLKVGTSVGRVHLVDTQWNRKTHTLTGTFKVYMGENKQDAAVSLDTEFKGTTEGEPNGRIILAKHDYTDTDAPDEWQTHTAVSPTSNFTISTSGVLSAKFEATPDMSGEDVSQTKFPVFLELKNGNDSVELFSLTPTT